MKKIILFILFTALIAELSYSQVLVTAPMNQPNTSGEYYSPTSITLTNGFSTTPGATFRAFIGNCVPMGAALNSDQNYIATYTPRQPFDALSDLRTKNICELMLSVKYFDGLGRPIQFSQVKGNPDGTKDLIQSFEYDFVGREVKKFLPYTKSLNGSYYPWNTGNLDGVYEFYNPNGTSGVQLPSGVPRINTPFAETRFESSMLERPVEQGAPGDPWQLLQGHTIKTAYSYNGANEVGQYIPYFNSTTNQLTFNSLFGAWLANTLVKTTTKDENWQASDGLLGTTEEFKDFEGQVILKRTYNKNSSGQIEVLNTNYVYDDYGNLIMVLPPANYGDAQHNNPANLPAGTFAGPVQQQIDDIGFQYRYDTKNRLVEKKLPGKGWEYFVYDKFDRVVMSQDANQRNHNNQEWLVTKYDKFGRMVATGIFIDAGSTANVSKRLTMQTNVGAASVNPPWEIRTTNAGNGYMNSSGAYNTYPTVLNNTQIVNYYDDYTFPGASTLTPQSTASTMTKGLLTGTRTSTTSGTASYLSLNFYDDDGHLKETFKENSVGGTDRIVNQFDFTNLLLSYTRTHKKGSQTTTISVNYDYDHMGRKIQTTESINNALPLVLSKLNYNEVGQIRTKRIHSNNGGQTFINSVNYLYNERGWLSSINDPDAVSTTAVFGEKLQYADGTAPQYNGNISNMTWQTVVPGGLNLYQQKQGYAFTYDKQNRLTKAAYSAPSIADKFNEEISYDLRGNILTLNRTNTTTANTFLNKFAYIYGSAENSGNKLYSVDDVGTANQDATYQYDDNGNVFSDSRNQITGINYNYLNLPNLVTRTAGNINYTYLAGGTKIKKAIGSNTRDYVDGIEYYNGNIDFILTDEGRAVPNGSGYGYEYYLKDHLGNTRAMARQDGSIGQVQDYYAFGLEMNPGNTYNPSPLNNYKYNGKEIQETGQYDYGARFYDPVIARWNRIDNKAEGFEAVSPYVYAVNDPINALDPDGNLIIFVNGFVPDHWLHKNLWATKPVYDRPFHPKYVPNPDYRPYPGDRNFASGEPHYLGQPFDYWGNIDNAFEQGYQDNHALYINASSDNTSEAKDRYAEGESAGKNLIKQLDDGSITLKKGETIKIVGHSQGGAFSAGMAAVLSKSEKYASILQEVVYLEPHQPADFTHPSKVPAVQISSKDDRVASRWNWLKAWKGKTSYQSIKGVGIFIPNDTHDGDDGAFGLWGHSVGTNLDEIVAYFKALGVTITVR